MTPRQSVMTKRVAAYGLAALGLVLLAPFVIVTVATVTGQARPRR